MPEQISPGQEAVEFTTDNSLKDSHGMKRMTVGEASALGFTDDEINKLKFVRDTLEPGGEPTKEFVLFENGKRESGRDIPLRWRI
jgi:hypothetical protein